jgi:hypothetical protein
MDPAQASRTSKRGAVHVAGVVGGDVEGTEGSPSPQNASRDSRRIRFQDDAWIFAVLVMTPLIEGGVKVLAQVPASHRVAPEDGRRSAGRWSWRLVAGTVLALSAVSHGS